MRAGSWTEHFGLRCDVAEKEKILLDDLALEESQLLLTDGMQVNATKQDISMTIGEATVRLQIQQTR
jgi:hypothetical protein